MQRRDWTATVLWHGHRIRGTPMRLSIAAALALALGACASDQPLPADQLAKYQACSANGDCTYTTNGCCCDAVAVAKNKVQELRAQFSCRAVRACEPSARQCAVCSSGRCAMELAPADGGACP